MLLSVIFVWSDISKHLHSKLHASRWHAWLPGVAMEVAIVNFTSNSRSDLSPFIHEGGVSSEVFAQSDILVVHLRKWGFLSVWQLLYATP